MRKIGLDPRGVSEDVASQRLNSFDSRVVAQRGGSAGGSFSTCSCCWFRGFGRCFRCGVRLALERALTRSPNKPRLQQQVQAEPNEGAAEADVAGAQAYWCAAQAQPGSLWTGLRIVRIFCGICDGAEGACARARVSAGRGWWCRSRSACRRSGLVEDVEFSDEALGEVLLSHRWPGPKPRLRSPATFHFRPCVLGAGARTRCRVVVRCGERRRHRFGRWKPYVAGAPFAQPSRPAEGSSPDAPDASGRRSGAGPRAYWLCLVSNLQRESCNFPRIPGSMRDGLGQAGRSRRGARARSWTRSFLPRPSRRWFPRA